MFVCKGTGGEEVGSGKVIQKMKIVSGKGSLNLDPFHTIPVCLLLYLARKGSLLASVHMCRCFVFDS